MEKWLDKNKKWILIPLALLSGILGRMGGSHDFNKLYRRIGCSFIFTLSAIIFVGKGLEFWWVYAIVFLMMWGSLSTYWDEAFGYDYIAFSGLVVGCSAIPLLIIDLSIWWLVALRTVALGIAWELIHRYRRPILEWKEDVVEEFLRYASSL